MIGQGDVGAHDVIFRMLLQPPFHDAQIAVFLGAHHIRRGVPRVDHADIGGNHLYIEPRQRGGDLLVNRHLEGHSRQLGKQPHLQTGDLLVPPIVEDEEITLVSSPLHQAANPGVLFGRQQIVGVEPQDPVAGRQFERDVAGG